MRIIDHNYKRYSHLRRVHTHLWAFTVKYNGVQYNGEIEYNRYTSSLIDGKDFDGYFVGYLWNPEIRARYKDSYISFGYSDVRNNVRYILEEMKRVIEGDLSNVVGVGQYKRDISDLK